MIATLPLCVVTGRIAGDGFACGDCDPCVDGASLVPASVKKLMRERDEWADKYADAMQSMDEKVDAERSACLRLAAGYGGREAEAIAELIGARKFAGADGP